MSADLKTKIRGFEKTTARKRSRIFQSEERQREDNSKGRLRNGFKYSMKLCLLLLKTKMEYSEVINISKC